VILSHIPLLIWRKNISWLAFVSSNIILPAAHVILPKQVVSIILTTLHIAFHNSLNSLLLLIFTGLH